MDALPRSQLLRCVERVMVLAHRAIPRFSTRYSPKQSTLRQRVIRLCLKMKKTTTSRYLVDERIETSVVTSVSGCRWSETTADRWSFTPVRAQTARRRESSRHS